MDKCENIINRIDRIDDVCAQLRCHALGFDMNLDDFINDVSDDEINVNEFLNFSVEFAKGGYGLSEFYAPTDELVFRYFCMVCLMMTYMTFPKEHRTFTTLDYLCELYDDDYETFCGIASAIKSDVFQFYFDKLEEATQFLISELKSTFEVLMINFIDKYTPSGVTEEICNIIDSEVTNYVNNNSYDVLLCDSLEEDAKKKEK